MENSSEPLPSERADANDPECFAKIKGTIERKLAEMKKVVDNISQMRVEAAYLESDLATAMDAATWADVAEMVGLGAFGAQITGKKGDT